MVPAIIKNLSEIMETKPGHHVSQKTRNVTHPVFSFAQCSDGKTERGPQIHYQYTTLLPNGKGGVPPAHTKTDPQQNSLTLPRGRQGHQAWLPESPGQAAAVPAVAI